MYFNDAGTAFCDLFAVHTAQKTDIPQNCCCQNAGSAQEKGTYEKDGFCCSRSVNAWFSFQITLFLI